MTSEQRNEIAMEVLDEVLTEATRYAKETHKKAEQVKKEIVLAKKRLSAIKNSPAKNKDEIIKKQNNKIHDLEDRLYGLNHRDTIANADKNDDYHFLGKDAAIHNSYNDYWERNYGRYAYKEPRKDVHNTAGDYKNL